MLPKYFIACVEFQNMNGELGEMMWCMSEESQAMTAILGCESED